MAASRMVVVALCALTLAACTPSVNGELLVSAASSLTDAFADVETAFEAANPEVDVVMNFGSSSSLREQIIEGAPVDVFASANTSNMDQVVEAGEADGGEI
ncbi:MAG: molybdate ABC transporter substrate-binding protein, partial [Acidimicrobiia bacterium]